ncbi:MAG: GDSL-type esterase/lipase family protein [Eubacteriales bacterium]|nr:GDSL-type esterase/lipase family protein [Eubacteriales bacterium]
MQIICLGDSFTEGFGVSEEENWVSLLDHSGSDSYINKGISGDTTSGMLARLHRDVISQHPHAALLIGGSNDVIASGSIEIVKCNMMAMIHQLFHYGIKPILSTPIPCIPEKIMPLWTAYNDFSTYNQKMEALNSWCRRFSHAFMCGYIDLYTPFQEAIAAGGADRLFLDGLHLVPEGQKMAAQRIAQAVHIDTYA